MRGWREEAITRRHNRKSFDCGSLELNEYLERYARQNHESGGAKTFVAVLPSEPTRVLGYYSISPGSIEFARVPAELTKKLGRYEVPVFRLGRLAVDRSVQGQGLWRRAIVSRRNSGPIGRCRSRRRGAGDRCQRRESCELVCALRGAATARR